MSDKEKGVNFEGLKRYDERLKEASNILQRNYEYHIDDIVHYKQYCLKCIRAGITSGVAVDFSSDVIIDGTVVWEKYKQKTVYYMNQPVGHIEYEYKLKEGFLALDGQTHLRADYPELIDWITTEELWTETAEYGKFGVGDGTTTFVMPNFLARFVEGSLESGVTKEAGLPNIEGEYCWASDIYGTLRTDAATSGAFKKGTLKNYQVNSGAKGTSNALAFDASRSNPIYGNSDTVQPKSVTLIPQIKYCNDTYINYIEENWSDFEDVYYKNSFTIIYPNGGTKENPANVTIGTTYIEANPFPNYAVTCQVELLYNNEWGVAPFNGYYSDHSYGGGAYAIQHNNNNIVLRTGSHTLLSDRYMYHLLPNTWTSAPNNIVSTLPCRVKVWKIGKIEE